MTQDLVHQMRTCAAHVLTVDVSKVLTDDQYDAIRDASKLLVEASNLLEVVEPLGEPMEMIPPIEVAT